MKLKEKIDDYYALLPTQFSVVESLLLRQNFDSKNVMKQNISLNMKKSLNEPSEETLYLDFYGVRGFKISSPDLSLISIPHIEIMLGKEVPNCAEKFYIRDPSQEQIIKFSCDDFEVAIKRD